jgi:hypothetical protein
VRDSVTACPDPGIIGSTVCVRERGGGEVEIRENGVGVLLVCLFADDGEYFVRARKLSGKGDWTTFDLVNKKDTHDNMCSKCSDITGRPFYHCKERRPYPCRRSKALDCDVPGNYSDLSESEGEF